jgi:HSP20 family molecular chaperone IbpA
MQVGETRAIDRSRPAPAADASTSTQNRVVEIRPSLDVLENGEEIRILADVPGVAAEHADVQIEMPQLRIACTRHVASGAAIRYAASLTLPETIEVDSLTAALRDGVLEISMRKSAQARARRIAVTRG